MDLGCSPGDGSHIFKILARREGHNRADLSWMSGRDLEDKRRRIAAAPQDHGQVLGRGPIKGCLEVWLRLLVARRLAEAGSGIVWAVQGSARALIDRQRGEPRSDQARR